MTISLPIFPALAALAAIAAGIAPAAASSFGESLGMIAGVAPAQDRPARFAQHSPIPPRNRTLSDAQGSYHGGRSGENRSFEELLRAAHARGRGEYLGVEPDIGRNVYRFKFMRPSGNVVWVDVDGRTARVLAEKD